MATMAPSMALHQRERRIVKCTSLLGRMFIDSWQHNNNVNSCQPACIDQLLGLEKPLINFVWPYCGCSYFRGVQKEGFHCTAFTMIIQLFDSDAIVIEY